MSKDRSNLQISQLLDFLATPVLHFRIAEELSFKVVVVYMQNVEVGEERGIVLHVQNKSHKTVRRIYNRAYAVCGRHKCMAMVAGVWQENDLMY